MGWSQATPPRPPEPNAPNPSLKQLSLEQLGNIEVTTVSKQTETVLNTPAAIYVLSGDDIRRSGVTTIPDALRLVPGVEVAQLDGNKWAIGIRGFEGRLSRAVLVLIDGRSVYSPLFAGVYWEVQDTLLEDVDRIEVIRGPGATAWGANAVNGVINIITKSSKETHGALISAGGGNVEQGLSHIRYGSGNDHFSYRLYAKGSSTGPQFHQDGNNFDRWGMGQGGFRTDWTPDSQNTLTIQGDAYGAVDGEYLGISSFSPPALPLVRGTGYFFGQNIMSRWSREISARSDFQLQAYFDRTDRHDLNYREIRNTVDIDFVHHWRLPRNTITWGAGARFSPSHFIQTAPTVIFTPEHDLYNIFSGFVQDEIGIIPSKLFFTLGTKLEHNSYSGVEIQPSGRLLWAATKRQTLWAAVTRAVRTPSRVEQGFQFTALVVPQVPIYVRLIGDGNFSPEQLVGYEAGYRSSFTRNLYVDVTAFYNEYDRLLSVENQTPIVETVPAPPRLLLPLLLRNGIRGNTRGVELAPAWQPVPWWRLRGSYSYVHLSMADKPMSNDVSTVRQLDGDTPQHEVKLQSSFDLPRNFEFDFDYRFVSSVPDQNIQSYSTADTRLGWRWSRSLDLSLTGQNLLRPYHFEYGGDPGPLVGISRSVYGQITWHSEVK